MAASRACSVVYSALLGEIGGERLLGYGRIDGGETNEVLAGARSRCARSDDEDILHDAQVRMSGLRQWRRAVNRQCAGMEKEPIEFVSPRQHVATLAGIDAEPAAGFGGALCSSPTAASTT